MISEKDKAITKAIDYFKAEFQHLDFDGTGVRGGLVVNILNGRISKVARFRGGIGIRYLCSIRDYNLLVESMANNFNSFD